MKIGLRLIARPCKTSLLQYQSNKKFKFIRYIILKVLYGKKVNRSVKISDDFYDYAKIDAELNHRSIASQIECWAKIGIAVEKTLMRHEVEELLKKYKAYKPEKSG